jgi:hypothetical protein
MNESEITALVERFEARARAFMQKAVLACWWRPDGVPGFAG